MFKTHVQLLTFKVIWIIRTADKDTKERRFFGVNIILLQHIQFHIVHLYRQFTLDWKELQQDSDTS